MATWLVAQGHQVRVVTAPPVAPLFGNQLAVYCGCGAAADPKEAVRPV
jgi:hypothetical protein